MTLDDDACYSALASRDCRLDGVFFVGVTTTGVYCRPVCPARTPGRSRCVFFESAAHAERAGFRACFRCRPELAPGSAPVDAVPQLVRAALRKIDAGALNEQSVEELARSLGVSERHLHRALVDALGLSPVELAQTQRLALAKRLLHDSSLGMTEIAFAAGFSSVRRFNSAFRGRFGKPPSALRSGPASSAAGAGSVRLRLDYRPPLAFTSHLGFLAARALPGVEFVEGERYRRVVRIGDRTGWLSVERDPTRPALSAEVSLSLADKLPAVVAGLRRLFDLDAKPEEIDRRLVRDPRLSRYVKRTPGRRVPGAFDGFETAVRAVLGQQVSVKGATTVAGRLVERFGPRVETPFPELRRVFPSSGVLTRARVSELAALGMPGARARALMELARAVEAGLDLSPGAALEPTLRALGELPGFGDWTTQYVAMRTLSWPDAFPATDLGVQKALGTKSKAAALAMAEAWRPWRAYATLHLWAEGASP
ncbi:MAG: DNA-3-methyladenine glycosylase 2 family protein [Myxococcales bacterium]|nr:DNA-3-methyladenine glycosylase 2 family protein [Myxococcales bacterium]